MLFYPVLLPPAQGAGQSSDVFDIPLARHYIAAQYDYSLGLVRENEHIDKFWLWSDNELAALVLRDYAPAISKNITNSISKYLADHTKIRSAYGTILGKDNTSFQAPVNKQITGKIWSTDFAGDSELQCADYADIAFLRAIHYYKIGEYQQSAECYQVALQMFDGIGFRDTAYAADGNRYSTYKVALWQIANDLIGAGETEVMEQAREIILGKMQDRKTGGVYTHYVSDMTPDSETNVETTSLTLLALDSSLLQPKTQSSLAPAVLQECIELGMEEEEEEEECSDKPTLGRECLRMNCMSTGREAIEVLQDPTVLTMYGSLAAGIVVGASIFFIKITKERKKKETGQ